MYCGYLLTFSSGYSYSDPKGQRYIVCPSTGRWSSLFCTMHYKSDTVCYWEILFEGRKEKKYKKNIIRIDTQCLLKYLNFEIKYICIKKCSIYSFYLWQDIFLLLNFYSHVGWVGLHMKILVGVLFITCLLPEWIQARKWVQTHFFAFTAESEILFPQCFEKSSRKTDMF